MVIIKSSIQIITPEMMANLSFMMIQIEMIYL